METLFLLVSAVAALSMTALVARAPALGPVARRERPGRLVAEVAFLFAVALVFPLWDHLLVDTLGAALPRVWSRDQGVFLGSVLLLLVPLVMAFLRPHGAGMLGWRWPRNGGAALAVVLFGALFGAIPTLLGVAVERPTALGLLTRLVTVAVLDENLFRGAIQGRLEAMLAGGWPWLLTGVLYGLWYAPGIFFNPDVRASVGVGGMLALLTLQMSLGWLLAMARDRTRSLLPGIAAHFLIDEAGSLLALLRG